MLQTLRATPDDCKVLILTDSQAATAALKKAGRLGKARTRDLREAVGEIKRQTEVGMDSVTLGWASPILEN